MRFAVLLVALLALAAPARADDAILLDGIAARVDEKVIVRSDVRERARPLIARGEPANRAMRAALDAMIDAIVVKKEADRIHVDVTDDEVRRARTTIMTENGLSAEQLSAEIRKQGMTEASWEALIREQIFEGKVLQLEIANQVRPAKPSDYEAWVVERRGALVQRLRAASTIEVRL